MKARQVRIFATLFLAMLFAFGPALSTVRAQSDSSDEGVAKYRDETKLKESAFGPAKGSLVHDADTIATAPAGINAENFYAKVRFVAPYDAADQLWDAGFMFRSGRDAEWRVEVLSDGTWNYRLAANDPIDGGSFEGLKTGEGDSNDIELAVDGDTGYLAVNQEEVASFDLSRREVSGDVQFAVTFSQDATKVGAQTDYSRYQVWTLPKSKPAAIAKSDTSILEQGRDLADTDDSLAEAKDASLTESPDGVANIGLGVDEADAYTRVTVTNPRDGADHPFDFGLGFRNAGDNNQYRIAIDSDGEWFFSLGVDAAIEAHDFDGLKTGEGDENVFELAVSGDRAVFAINGDTIGAVDVSDQTDPGDIFLGVGFYPDADVVDGGETAYSDFATWSLSSSSSGGDDATPASGKTKTPTKTATKTKTPTPESEDETPTAISGSPEEIFQAYLSEETSLEMVFGPESGDMIHDPDSLSFADTALDVTDFVAHADFVNPYAAGQTDFDIGFLFRVGSQEPHLRLVVISSGDWLISPSTDDPIATGRVTNLNTGAGEHNTMDLVVVGDTGYFGVNDEFISELDLSSVTQSGDLALGTSFFQGNFKEGADTAYEDFTVWEIPAGSTSTGGEDDETTPEPEDASSYESPTYGYQITWDPDIWTVDSQSSDDGTDRIRLLDELSSVDLTGYESDLSPQECLDSELEYFQTGDGYSDAEIAQDKKGDDMTGKEDGYSWAVYAFTYTASGSDPLDYYAYVECRPIEAGKSILQVVQYISPDDYDDDVDQRTDLLANLVVTGGEEESTPEASPESNDDGDETPVSGGGSVTVALNPVGDDGTIGLASFSENGNRTAVKLLAPNADDGTIAIIQEGTCDNLSGDPAFLLSPLDEGESETNIKSSLADITSGDYVITMHASLDDLTEAISCGEIKAKG